VLDKNFSQNFSQQFFIFCIKGQNFNAQMIY
jgi:hypothetical protein